MRMVHCCAVKGRLNTDGYRRYSADTGRPHHQGADDERLAVREAV